MKIKEDSICVNEKNKELIFTVAMIVIGILFFFFIGEKGYVLSRDSEIYINGYYGTTVMPLYIFFMDCLKWIFGTQIYLNMAIIIQGILAIAASIFLTRYIQKTFALKSWQMLIVYILSFLPYAYSLPSHIATHEIMTEAVAFPIFYFFFIFFFDGIKEMHWIKFGISAGIAFLLIFIRSQLLILIPVLIIGSAILFIRKRNIKRKSIILFLGICLLLLIGVFIALKNTDNPRIFRFLDGTQIGDALVGRTIYISDSEDINLFSDKDVQGAFQVLYDFAEENDQRYSYNDARGKTRFDKIAEGINYITRSSWELLVDYCEGNGWHYTRSEEFQTDIAITLIFNHMDLFLINFFELAFPSLMAAIFVQKESIYTLCIWATVILYGIGILLAVLDRKKKNACLLYLLVMLILVINVVLVNILFMGLQRYVVYTFGLYYISLFIICCDLMKTIKDKSSRRV